MLQGLKCQHPEERYIVTPYTIEFSPTQDGTEPYIELNITEPEKLGWKLSILGSKQVTQLGLMRLQTVACHSNVATFQ